MTSSKVEPELSVDDDTGSLGLSLFNNVPCPWLRDPMWRLCTFSSYPTTAPKSAIILADNGFVYFGNGSPTDHSVVCLFCNAVKSSWKPSDDIASVHAELSPCCPIVGEQRLSLVEVPLNRPDGIRYAFFNVRFGTFVTWPRTIRSKPWELAEYGFYFTGQGDAVRCWSCGGGLLGWEDGDNVRVEHARHFPSCSFMREKLGQRFVDVVSELKATRPAQLTLPMVLNRLSNEECTSVVSKMFSTLNVYHFHRDENFPRSVRGCKLQDCTVITDKPDHPGYSSYKKRCETFHGRLSLPNSNLAFVYIYDSERGCVCHYCGEQLHFDLRSRESQHLLLLLKEHARFSPSCGYIRRLLGDRIINVLLDKYFKQLVEYLPDIAEYLRKLKKVEDSLTDGRRQVLDENIIRNECYSCKKSPAVVYHPCSLNVFCEDCLVGKKLCACQPCCNSRYLLL